jgi:hypothetical protein
MRIRCCIVGPKTRQAKLLVFSGISEVENVASFIRGRRLNKAMRVIKVNARVGWENCTEGTPNKDRQPFELLDSLADCGVALVW